MSNERHKLFDNADDEGDLSRFTPRPVSGVPLEEVRAVSHAAGFPTRDAPQAKYERHYFRTGRDTQFNTKVKRETKTGYETIARELGLPLGKVLEDALAALQEKLARS
jgi:hypothetical protein